MKKEPSQIKLYAAKQTKLYFNRKDNTCNLEGKLGLFLLGLEIGQWRCSVYKGVVNDFANFANLCWSLFFVKLQAFRPVKFVKFLRTLILKNICERLLLSIFIFDWEILRGISYVFCFIFFGELNSKNHLLRSLFKKR